MLTSPLSFLRKAAWYGDWSQAWSNPALPFWEHVLLPLGAFCVKYEVIHTPQDLCALNGVVFMAVTEEVTGNIQGAP